MLNSVQLTQYAAVREVTFYVAQGVVIAKRQMINMM
jgi:hypothetical protein